MKIREWYSVYARETTCPDPQAMVAALRPRVKDITLSFPDGEGWEQGSIFLAPERLPLLNREIAPFITLSRRTNNLAEQLSWSTGLVVNNGNWPGSEHRETLLSHLKATGQVINIMPMPMVRVAKMARICEQLCGYLCRELNGLIQVYQEGFFSREGESLFPKNPIHRLKTS